MIAHLKVEPVRVVILLLVWLVLFLFFWWALATYTQARDLDGRYAQSPLKGWFDSLKSGKGELCCSIADGRTVADPDVDMDGAKYRVRIDGVWHDVPAEAIVIVPNKFGQPVVWPVIDSQGRTQIRCFMPGAGT